MNKELSEKVEDMESSSAELGKLEEWKKEAGEIPGATCPDIDRVIKDVDSAMSLIKTLKKDDNKDVADYASDAYYDLSGVEDELEKLRESNSQLRSLGEFWYEKCKELLT